MMGDVKVARVNQRGTGQVAEGTKLASREKTRGRRCDESFPWVGWGGVETEAKLMAASQ